MKKPICAMVAVAVATSGCAGLWNPHVRTGELDKQWSESKGAKGLQGDLPSTIDMAQGQVQAYVQAAGNHSRLRNTSVLLLVPLSAVMLYKSITIDRSQVSKNLTALGLLGERVPRGILMGVLRPVLEPLTKWFGEDEDGDET